MCSSDLLFSGLCNKLDPCMLVSERDTLRFFIKHSCSSIICVECLDIIVLAASSCFSCIYFSQLLDFVVRKYSLVFSLLVVSNKLIGVWLKGNYHVGSVKRSACIIL